MPHQFHQLRPITRIIAALVTVLAVGVGYRIYGQVAAPERTEADAKQADAPLGEEWVRISQDAQGRPAALEVAIVRYVPAEQVEQRTHSEWVDLVGAVHIGDKGYYQQLNKRFRQYDTVLYELVAPKGTVVQQGQGTSNTNPLGAMQNAMKSMLEIEHQLEQIDYTQPNFVHADLSPEEFLQSMKNRDEGFMKLYFRLIGQAVAEESQQAARGQSTDVDLLAALLSKDRPRKLKIALAKQFESMEAMLAGFAGPDGSTLITERNKRALKVLGEQQAAGKQKIAIFYGAGHLTDMHEQMVKQFNMRPIGITWLEAWNLRKK